MEEGERGERVASKTHSLAKTPLKAAQAPLATASMIHCVRPHHDGRGPPTRSSSVPGMATSSSGSPLPLVLLLLLTVAASG